MLEPNPQPLSTSEIGLFVAIGNSSDGYKVSLIFTEVLSLVSFVLADRFTLCVWCMPCNIFGAGVYYICYSIFIILSKFQEKIFLCNSKPEFLRIWYSYSVLFHFPKSNSCCDLYSHKLLTLFSHCFFLLLTRHIFLKKPITCIMTVRKKYLISKIQSKQKWLVVIFVWKYIDFSPASFLFSFRWPSQKSESIFI